MGADWYQQQNLIEEQMMTEITSKEVYKAINAVTKEMSEVGIKKAGENKAQNYKFRGIDDVYNALSSVISKHGLCILPAMLERNCEERMSNKNSALFYVTVKARFDLVSAIDGSSHSIFTYGEAMDSGDKATNKAMSAAYKYACMQAFCIPTEGDNDADATTHVVAPKPVNVERINQQQMNQIIDLLIATETLEADFCARAKIEKLEQLPAAVFDKAKAALNKKREKQ